MQLLFPMPCMPPRASEGMRMAIASVFAPGFALAPPSFSRPVSLIARSLASCKGRMEAKVSVSFCDFRFAFLVFSFFFSPIRRHLVSRAVLPLARSRGLGDGEPSFFLDGSDDRTLDFNPCCHSLQTIPGTCIAVQNAAHVTLRMATPPHPLTGPRLATSPDLPVAPGGVCCRKKNATCLWKPRIRARSC